ncbi:MAG: hypothetical protein NTV51_19820 [Verrucomicrobia bacterium]|nr:hypothetical protein [Verrucomicrobiota bacterium]
MPDHASLPAPRASRRTRALRALRWLLPGVGLALIPKCPACLAAYLALGTGLAVSLPVAETLRTGLFVVCGGALGWLALNRLRRLRAARSRHP